MALASDDRDVMRQVESFVRKNLLHAPPEIKNKFPRILSKHDVSIFVFSTVNYMIVAFLDSREKERVIGLRNKNTHPFFALVKPPNVDAPAFFRLDAGTRNTYVGKMTLKDGFGFSIGKDCTLVIEELRQSVLLKEEERYQYDIDLAYVVSFGNEIKKENVLQFLKDIISYSFEIWRKGHGKSPE